MAGHTESTGHGLHSIYKEQHDTGGEYQICSSGTKIIVEDGAALELESGSTFNIESGAVGIIEGVMRVASGGEAEIQDGGKLELLSGGELELESGSTLNIEAGAAINLAAGAIERASIVTYTCSTMKLNIWDRYVVLRSSNNRAEGTSDNCWTIRHPQDAKKGIIKTIFFESKKGSTHTLAIRTTSKKIGFNSTNKHALYAGGTNPLMVTTGGTPGISVTLMAASSSIWKIMSPMTTDKNAGMLQLTSSTECTI